MIGLSLAPTTPAQRRTNAAWIREQLAVLIGWVNGPNADRWPQARIAVALRAIHAGDERWVDRTAEVQK